MSGSMQVNTACETSAATRALHDTCDELVRRRIPNLLRLYLNPYVAQTCYCLTRWIETEWPAVDGDDFQVFLANSFEEALSGAMKLARYAANADGVLGTGLILDEDGRLTHFAMTDLGALGTIEYIPALRVVSELAEFAAALTQPAAKPGFVVVSGARLKNAVGEDADELRRLLAAKDRPFLVVWTEHNPLSSGGEQSPAELNSLQPDVVVFDESFVEHAVPFGAFAGARRVYQHWNRRGMATFHSTTYQPNAISNFNFMQCLRRRSPEFVARHHDALERFEREPRACREAYRKYYSRSLAKLITTVGFDRLDVRAVGHYVEIDDRRWFDAVAGVACSIRGHNPPSYVSDLHATPSVDECRDEATARLHALSGLPHAAPAVSGASAVEHALKLALAAKLPRSYVLALRGGFGGKTLFALTGTWKPALRAGLDPLYPQVVYVDPFAPDAETALEEAFRLYPIAVIQAELVQGVGGVRPLPSNVLAAMNRLRRRHDCLLFVDEVQTGMFRTGPFVCSRDWGVHADLVTIGKGTSDMMFPFALTLYSEELRRTLEARGCTLPRVLAERYGYDTGYRTLLQTLRRAERTDLADHVRARGDYFAERLRDLAHTSRRIRDVRCFGLLIGLELDVGRRSWLRKLLPQLYLLGMIRHPTFPVIAGFCQYEPHVFKLTPPLSITDQEIDRVCATIADVLDAPLGRLAAAGAWQAFVRTRAVSNRK